MQIFSRIKGDKTIWAAAALLAIFSFLPVYSASSNLAYLYGDGNTFPYLVNHFIYIFLGFVIMFFVHNVPYHYFIGISILMLPILSNLQSYNGYNSQEDSDNPESHYNFAFVESCLLKMVV